MTCSQGLGLAHLRGDCLANLTSDQPLQLPRGTGERGASEVACSAVISARTPTQVGLWAVEEGGGRPFPHPHPLPSNHKFYSIHSLLI